MIASIHPPRYFINKIADKLLVFEDNGAKFYPINYAEYELVLKEREEVAVAKKVSESNAQTGAKKSFSTPLKDRGKKERRVKRLEELINVCEDKKAELSYELEKPEVYSDYIKVGKIQEDLDGVMKELDSYTEEWLTLLEELEN